MAQILEDGMDEDTLGNPDSGVYANIFWALCLGIAHWKNRKQIIGNDKNRFESTLDTAFEILGRGIKACRRADTNSIRFGNFHSQKVPKKTHA
jgi:hypothetical protein